MLNIHKQLSDDVIFAGGSWIWNGIAPNYSKTFACTKAALQTCKKYLMKEVLCTAWMDNGAETLGVRMKAAYDKKQLLALKEICEKEIPETIQNLEEMKVLREDLWMSEAKPLGYELMDVKLGAVITRLNSTIRRTKKYLDGSIPCLEELEETRLPYFEKNADKHENRWSQIIKWK